MKSKKSKSSRPSVFISYSHKDARWLNRLLAHLKPLVRQEDLEIWSDKQITPGDDWHAEIKQVLDKCSAAVLLISAPFLASDYIASNELPILLHKAKRRGLRIVPLLISPSVFQSARFKFPDPKRGPKEISLASFQGINSPSTTLSAVPAHKQEQILSDLAEFLARHAVTIAPKKSKTKLSKGKPSKIKRLDQTVYKRLIDLAAKNCMFANWKGWTVFALKQPAHWREEWREQFDQFGTEVLRAPWPGTIPELERALQTLSKTLEITMHHFNKHIDREENGWLIGDKFYRRRQDYDYFNVHREYKKWIQDCGKSIFEATKAANWVAEIVRKYIDPSFMLVPGKFVIVTGPHVVDEYLTHLPEYTPAEKAAQPAAIEQSRIKLLKQQQKPFSSRTPKMKMKRPAVPETAPAKIQESPPPTS